MTTDPQKPQFVYVTYIATTAEKLWSALTTTDLITKYWGGRHNTSDWQAGSAIESRSPEGELEWHGRVLESQPPRRLVYTFDVVGNDEPASRVTFQIKPQGDSVRLEVTHGGFPPGSTVLPNITEGWPAILSGLKTLLETGRPMDQAIHAEQSEQPAAVAGKG
jgi:uncharacterized protein YndB with AHSA1/START domain